jgi:hypothetical protein
VLSEQTLIMLKAARQATWLAMARLPTRLSERAELCALVRATNDSV